MSHGSARSKPRISKSSTEIEYRSMPVACSEIVWICRLMSELHISIHGSTTLHVENTIVQISTNLIHHKNIKHIEVDCHYIRELVDQVISFQHITSHDQLTNLFTKTMTRSRHRFLFDKEHQFERKC